MDVSRGTTPDTESCVWIERAAAHVAPVGFLDFYRSWIELRLARGVTTFFGSALLGTGEHLISAVLSEALTESQRVRACMGLSCLRDIDGTARRTLRDAFERLPPSVRAGAVPIVVGAEEGCMSIDRAMDDDAPVVRIAAIRHLRAHDRDDGLARIARLLEDADDRVAESALFAVSGTPHLPLSVLERLFERPRLRALVTSELGRSSDPAAGALLERALHDERAAVRRVAAFALSAPRFQSAHAAALRDALAAEGDPTVRNALERSLRADRSRS